MHTRKLFIPGLWAILILMVPSNALCTANASQLKTEQRKRTPRDNFLPDVVVFKLKKNTHGLLRQLETQQVLARIQAQYHLQDISQIFPPPLRPGHVQDELDESMARIYTAHVSGPLDVPSLCDRLRHDPSVEYAEPHYIQRLYETPNDPYISNQNFLSQIGAFRAWDVVKGDSTIIIGIVDSGVDWHHDDLSAHIWINTREIPNNGIDDDHNGFVDDVHGWDFAGNDGNHPDNDPKPGSPHGTHVAGIAAAVTNNGIGVAGVGFSATIMPVKTSIDNFSSTWILYGYEGIKYAVDNGASIINCSWGGGTLSQFEAEVLRYAEARGSLIVAAAGNDSSSSLGYPASYPGVLSVASVDANDKKSPFSNYGYNVGISAPGESIFSTYPANQYRSMWGTSMATPVVSGTAILVKALHPSWVAGQIAAQIRSSATPIDSSNPSYAGLLGAGRVDAYAAVTAQVRGFSITSVRLYSPDGVSKNRTALPGDTVFISITLKNWLEPVNGITVNLKTSDPYIELLRSSATTGSLNTLDTTTLDGQPFITVVHSNVPYNHEIELLLEATSSGVTDRKLIALIANPTFQNHDVNNIVMTLTSRGTLAFDDYPDNTRGEGFIYKHGPNLLFEGAIVCGTDNMHIIDVARGPNPMEQDRGLAPVTILQMKTPGRFSAQEGSALLSDEYAGSARIGLNIHLQSFAWTLPGEQDFVILTYTIKNVGATPIASFYFGMYYDWDLGTAMENIAGVDVANKLGYAYDTDTAGVRTWVGVKLLTSSSLAFRAIANPDTSRENWGVWDGFTFGEKWQALSSGVSKLRAGPDDISFLIGTGPFNIAASDSIVVGFAIVAGDDSAALFRHALAAQTQWNDLTLSSPEEIPALFSLEQNYPNPFNSATTITFSLPQREKGILKVFDVLGREVATLINGEIEARRQSVLFDARNLPSGLYFYQLRTSSHVATRKMLLLR
ncbi:MAG: S8 family serine peptidase [Bacteroidota bacterium]